MEHMRLGAKTPCPKSLKYFNIYNVSLAPARGVQSGDLDEAFRRDVTNTMHVQLPSKLCIVIQLASKQIWAGLNRTPNTKHSSMVLIAKGPSRSYCFITSRWYVTRVPVHVFIHGNAHNAKPTWCRTSRSTRYDKPYPTWRYPETNPIYTRTLETYVDYA
jgi:hypothetical protein